MSDLLRTFIAIELKPELRAALDSIQLKLKTAEADVKWVRPENIHITLKFLGGITAVQVRAVLDIFPEICDGFPSFEIRLAGLGAFPNLRHPRVIWAGVEDKDQRLKLLAGRFEEILFRLGFPKEEREFTSHITLGRVRSAHNLYKLAQILPETLVPPDLTQCVSSVTLFKSTLSPKGPTYESLLTYELAHSLN